MILKNGKRLDGCSDTVPIGTINPYLGTTPPFGYLLLDGSMVSKITYPELYAICGTTFGPETTTEFKLPDLRGQTIAGYKQGDATFGTLGGLIGSKTISYTPSGTNTNGAVQSHTLTIDEIPSHDHVQNDISWVDSSWLAYQENSHYGTSKAHGSKTDVTGGGQGHTHGFTNPTFTGTEATLDNIQPTAILNWIVKAMLLIPVQATIANSKTTSSTNVYSTTYVNDILDQLKREAFDFAHPVGSYYETSDSTWTPTAAGWYGTWTLDNDGSILVSYKSSGNFNKSTGTIVGGESINYTPAGSNTGGSVGNHTLTAAESGLPSHSHCIRIATEYNGNAGIYRSAFATNSDWWGGENNYDTNNRTNSVGGDNASSGHNHPFTNPTFTGTQATLSTIQTSKVIYRWHRTA